MTVGPREELDVREITGERPVWRCDAPDGPFTCQVQLRAHGEVYDCTAEQHGDDLRITLTTPPAASPPARPPSSTGDRVLASSTIAETATVPA